MMTLGGAQAPQYGPEWLNKTIVSGVKDGMREAHMTRKPPIIVRAHATRIENATGQALPLYRNIYAMHKWNGEFPAWTGVHGEVLRMHNPLSSPVPPTSRISTCSTILNLGAGDRRHSSNKRSHPCTASESAACTSTRFATGTGPSRPTTRPELQCERDWICFEAWARYAWNPNRDLAAEREYWIGPIAGHSGNRTAAAHILDADEWSGVCTPRPVPRIGITEGNQQSLTFALRMTKLIDPVRYNAPTLLWEGDAPPGKRLDDCVRGEWNHRPYEGETPVGVAAEVLDSANRAAATEAAAPFVITSGDDFARFLNGMRSIAAKYACYKAKTKAAGLILRYGHSRDTADLE